MRRTTFLIAFLVLSVATAFISATALSQAQTVPPAPTPSPPQPPALASGCGKSGPSIQGGQTTGLSGRGGSLTVALPPGGTYFTLPASSLTDPGLFICSVENDASVTISATTGREVSRSANTAAGNAVLDQIVASASLTGSPDAFTPPQAPPPLVPPSAGDAGLKASVPERRRYHRDGIVTSATLVNEVCSVAVAADS